MLTPGETMGLLYRIAQELRLHGRHLHEPLLVCLWEALFFPQHCVLTSSYVQTLCRVTLVIVLTVVILHG